MPAHAAEFALDEIRVDGLGSRLQQCRALGAIAGLVKSGECPFRPLSRPAERGGLLARQFVVEQIEAGILLRASSLLIACQP